MLADALAAPEGHSLKTALVVAQSVSPMFARTVLQTASVADGAPPELAPELIMICWAPDVAHREQSDGSLQPTDEPTVDAAPPPPAAAAATQEAGSRSSDWLECSSWLGARTAAARPG